MCKAIQLIRIREIAIDGYYQVREKEDADMIARYAEIYRGETETLRPAYKLPEGVEPEPIHNLPPVTLFHLKACDGDPKPYLLVDGFHRVKAAMYAGLSVIPAVVEEVEAYEDTNETKARAFITALKNNSRHGVTLTQKDRKKAARILMELQPSKPLRELAKIVGVSKSTISNWRHEFFGTEPEPRETPTDAELGQTNFLDITPTPGDETITGDETFLSREIKTDTRDRNVPSPRNVPTPDDYSDIAADVASAMGGVTRTVSAPSEEIICEQCGEVGTMADFMNRRSLWCQDYERSAYFCSVECLEAWETDNPIHGESGASGGIDETEALDVPPSGSPEPDLSPCLCPVCGKQPTIEPSPTLSGYFNVSCSGRLHSLEVRGKGRAEAIEDWNWIFSEERE